MQGFLSIEFISAPLPYLPAHVVANMKLLCRLWFSAGVVAASMLAVVFTGFLAWNISNALITSESLAEVPHAAGRHMTPLLPGINMPLADGFLLLAAIGIATAVVSDLPCCKCCSSFVFL